MITPPFGLYPLKHGESQDLLLAVTYASLYNLLDLPCGVVPVGVVRKEEEYYEDPYHNDKATKRSKESVKGAEGLPLAVQVIGFPFQEEICLNLMKQIELAMNFKAKPNI